MKEILFLFINRSNVDIFNLDLQTLKAILIVRSVRNCTCFKCSTQRKQCILLSFVLVFQVKCFIF